jgi:hypothetical protein
MKGEKYEKRKVFAKNELNSLTANESFHFSFDSQQNYIRNNNI